MKPKIRTRVKLKHVLIGTILSPVYIIECLINRKWIPFADKNGLATYETEEAAQTYALELQQLDFAK